MRVASRTLLFSLFLGAGLWAATAEVRCRVSYVAADAIFLDAGSQRGLGTGDKGRVLRDGTEIGTLEVLAVSASSARARVLASTRDFAAGDTVLVTVTTASERAPEGRKAPDAAPEFTPLLERLSQRAYSAPSNLKRGSVTFRQLLHIDNEDSLDYTTTLLGLHGSIERLAGSPWAIRWSVSAGVRDGDAFDGSDLEGLRLDVYGLSIGRRLNDDGGHLLFGRFTPRGVPGLGYVDGAHGELVLESGARVGTVLGFRPTRDDLTPSLDEPLVSLYGTWARGKRGSKYVSATLAGLATFFDGELDRAALLPELHGEAGRFRGDISAEIDLDVGATSVRNGTRLTRLDTRVVLEVSRALELRAGADHWEQLDNAATRDIVGTDPAVFDRGFWRYWIGARAQVTDRLTLDAEIAQINAPGRDPTTHARLTATGRFERGTLTLSAFTLAGNDSIDGVGFRLDGYIPAGRWTLSPSLGFDVVDDFSLTDIRFRADRSINERWSGFGSVAYLAGDAVSSALLEFGFTYRW